MPTRLIGALALIATLPLAACSGAKGDAATQRQPGPAASRDFALSGFDRIELAGADAVVVRTGAAFAIRAEAPQDVLDRLELTVANGVLKVGRKKNDWSWSRGNAAARVSVAMPALNGATITGSGDMAVDRAGGGGAFAGQVTGSGTLDIARLEARQARLGVAGSGDLKARGRIAQGDYSVAGAGRLRVDDLQAETIRASMTGSGEIAAQASAGATISLVGSGDVRVGGGARCTVSRVGSGAAKCV